MYIYIYTYVLYNLLWEYTQGRYRSQLIPPLLLYCDPQLLYTYSYLLVPTLATGAPPIASCSWPYTILTHLDGQMYIYITLYQTTSRYRPLAYIDRFFGTQPIHCEHLNRLPKANSSLNEPFQVTSF